MVSPQIPPCQPRLPGAPPTDRHTSHTSHSPRPFRHCEERSDAAISPLRPIFPSAAAWSPDRAAISTECLSPRHCERPKEARQSRSRSQPSFLPETAPRTRVRQRNNDAGRSPLQRNPRIRTLVPPTRPPRQEKKWSGRLDLNQRPLGPHGHKRYSTTLYTQANYADGNNLQDGHMRKHPEESGQEPSRFGYN